MSKSSVGRSQLDSRSVVTFPSRVLASETPDEPSGPDLEDDLEIAEIRHVFERIDLNSDGDLSLEEVRNALILLKVPLSDQDTVQFYNLFKARRDLSQDPAQVDQGVSFEEFFQFVRNRDRALRQVFDQFDLDHTGKLDQTEIAHALRSAGLDGSPDTVKSLIRKLDRNHDGYVDYKEFRMLALLSPTIETRMIFEKWRQGNLDYGEPSYAVPEAEIGMPWLSIVIAGGIAGSVSRTATAPFDRLKTLLQAGTPIEGQKVSGIAEGMKAIYRQGGMRAFFRGNGVNVLKITPESATRWFAFEHAMDVIVGKTKQDREDATAIQRFFAGAMAGVSAQTAVYPLEVAKTRLAVSPNGSYSGLIDCLMKTSKLEGPSALFRGLAPSLLGIVPYAGVDMSVYFTLKAQWLKANPGERHPDTLTVLAMGAGSSICGQTIAYPLQLVRTRLQTVGSPGYVGPNYLNMADCFKQVIKLDGVLGLYRGIGPNFLKAVPAISISYGVYEKIKIILGL